MTIEKLAKENGSLNHEGKKYVLLRQAYIDGFMGAPYYTALAIIPADGLNEDGLYTVYRLTWYPLQSWLDGDREDERDACDWDSPNNVAITGSGYDMEHNCII